MRSSSSRRLLAVATATLLGAPLLAVTPAVAADDVTINLVGINDFHGRIDAATVQWAGTIKQLEADAPGNSLLVSAGDNISASLFASAVQDDNPTIDVLNAVGLDASATGNHEFDKGYDDLVNRVIPRADFPILGANVKKSDGSDALDPSATFDIDGVKVAVIGAVTQETPTLVSPAGVEGLTFGDPVTGINAEAARLKALPEADRPDVMVASFHEGAPDGTLSLPQAIAGSAVFRHLVEDTTADVDAIFMGHTHQKYAYDAPVPGASGKTRPVIQTGNYGENVGQIKLQVNPDTGDVSSYTLKNTARITTSDADLIKTYPELAQVKSIRDAAVTEANRVGNVPKGRITADITRAFTNGAEDRGSESTAGGLVADALLETVAGEPAGADIGIVNPGGLRSPDLTFAGVPGSETNTDGVVTFAELNSVLPFANNLNSVELTGASLKKVLEQQWQRDAAGNVPSRAYLQLGVSKNVHYTFDATRPEGSRITSVLIDGAPLDPAKKYKVATFSFLAAGGDNFRAFKEGTNTDTGLVDRDGWVAYFEKNSPISPDFAKRSVEVNGVKASYEPGETATITLPRLDLTSNGSPKNTQVAASLAVGGSTVDLGTFPVTAGAATLTFDVPASAAGRTVTLTATAASSGTTVAVPLVVKFASTVTGTAPERARTGTTFTVDATVTSDAEGDATGTVSVKDGSTVLGTATLSGGKASIEVQASPLSIGEHPLTLVYSGDDQNASSTGEAGTVDVVKGSSGITAAPAAGTYGTSTTVTVTADPEASGLVYVTQAGRTVGLGFLRDGTGTVMLDGTALVPGSYDLDVYFGGDEKFDPTATTTTVTIVKGATSTRKASIRPSKIVRNRTKPFVTLTVKGEGFTVDGGTVTLRQSGKSYTGTVKAGKVRIRLGKFPSSGPAKKVTATYSGNGVANGSSTTFTVKVLKK